MLKTIRKLLTFSMLIVLVASCGSTQKLSKAQMEERITKLENENNALRKDMQLLQTQVRQLINALPKPGGPAQNGGARPQNSGSASQIPANATTISFEKTVHDFGKIKEGEKVEYIFKFTNTGSKPLQIERAKASCGCTVPQWPREPIAPGATGEIKVAFNSHGKRGMQHKSVTLTANTEPVATRIYIKAEVE